jgi:transcriptional regulator with XRE-family HTH domain
MKPSKPAELLKKRLSEAFDKHGAVADFCRKTGFSRGAAENWRQGTQVPTVDKLGPIAEALGTTPAELLSEGPPKTHTLEDCLRAVAEAATGKALPQPTKLEVPLIPKDILDDLATLPRADRDNILKTLRISVELIKKRNKLSDNQSGTK